MNHLLEITKLCLKCKNAPCLNDCPIHNNIPKILKLYENGDYQLAYDELMENNPLAPLCGEICPHEFQCAKNCKAKKAFNKRVQIELIEQDLIKRFGINYTFPKVNKGQIIVIGAGVAGLTASILLRKAGYKIVLCEAENKIGGVIATQIPRFRFDDQVLNQIYFKIKDYIDIKFNTILGVNLKFEDLTKYDYQIFALGSNTPITILNKDNVLNGYQVLRDLKQNNLKIQNKKIGVLGCGNAAIDIARSLKKLNNEVHIIYRRDLKNAPATKFEINAAIEDGVQFNELLTVEDYNHPTAILRKMELLSQVGNERQQFIKTSELFESNYDYLVEAYGTNPDYSSFKNIDWFNKLNNHNWLDKDSYLDTYFVGDYFNHATSIVKAIAHAKKIVADILENEKVLERIKKESVNQKIIFGGSFNPPTIAHIELYNYLKKHLNKDIIILPNGDHYPAKKLLSFEQRIDLINLAFENPQIDDYEKTKNFVGTYKYLEQKKHPLFVIGSDSLNDLSGWIEGNQLIRDNKFIVFKRSDQNIEEIFNNDELLQKHRENFYILNINLADVSSTKFRETFDKTVVSDNVYNEIIRNNYYK